MEKLYTSGRHLNNAVIVLLMAILFLLPGFIQTARAINPPSSTIYVDDDYNSSTPGWGVDHFSLIQDAVNAAFPGDYINVADGNYPEQVTITISLTITGAGWNSSIVQSPATRPGSVTQGSVIWDYVVAAYAPTGTIDVKIENLGISGNGQSKTPGTDYYAGLFLRDVNGTTSGYYNGLVFGFSATPFESYGIKVYGQSDLTLSGNRIWQYYGEGIGANGGTSGNPDVMISNNELGGSASPINAIALGDGATGTIYQNTIGTLPTGCGISVWSDNILIDLNQISNCYQGINLMNASGLTVKNNTIQSAQLYGIIMDNVNNSNLQDNNVEDPLGTANAGLLLRNGSTGNIIGSDGHPNHFTLHVEGEGDLIGVHLDASLGAASNSFNYNAFSGGRKQFQVDAGVTGTTIIDHNSFNAILPGDFAAISIYGGEVHLTNNMHGAKPRGILIDGATNVIINGESFGYGCSEYAINLLNATGTKNISGNSYQSLEGPAFIGGAGADNLVYDCNTTWGANVGVLIQEGCTGAAISNNYFYSVATCIKSYEDLMTVTGNIFFANNRGIDAYKALTAHGNYFNYTYQGAMFFYSNDPHDVSNNCWTSSGGPSVFVNGIDINPYYVSQHSTYDFIQANTFNNLDYVPWLLSDDLDPNNCGYQYDPLLTFAPVYANADSSTTETEQYGSIQAAMDQSSLPYVFAKTGPFTEQVTINRSVNLTGLGPDQQTQIQAPATRTKSVTEGTTTWDYVVAAYSTSPPIDVKITNFNINDNGQNKTPGTDYLAGVFFRDVAGRKAGLFNCYVQGFPQTPELECYGIKICGASDLTIDHNFLYYYTRDGISADAGTTGNPDVTISFNNLYGSEIPVNGIYFGDGVTGGISYNKIYSHIRPAPVPGCAIFAASDGISIENNEIQSCYSGITVLNADAATIKANYFKNCVSLGITLDNVTNSIIQENNLENPASINEMIRLLNGSSGSLIGGNGHANSMSAPLPGTGTGYGIHLYSSVGTGSNTISYNYIGGNPDILIDTGVTGTTTIDHNQLYGSEYQYAQVVVNGGEIIITNNYLYGTTVRDIKIDGAINVDISDNWFNYGGSEYGINIINASGNKNISENTFFGQSGTAFISDAGCDNLVFDCNQVYANYGLSILEGSTGVQVTNNDFECTNMSLSAHEDLFSVAANLFLGSAVGIETWAALTAHQNRFGGNVDGSVVFHSNDNHDLAYNWWGYYGPKVYLNGSNLNTYQVADQGETILANTFDNIDFVPWLQTSTDAAPDICGFQPDPYYSFAPVYANNDGSNTETEQYPSIQAAIDQSLLPYVKAKSGTFTEQVTIDRSVNVSGDNKNTILVPFSTRTGTVAEGTTDFDYMMAAYPASGTIDVKISGFTFNDQSQNKASGTDMLATVIFKDIAGTNAGLFNCTYAEFPGTPALDNIMVKSFGNSDLTIDHNIFPGFAGDYAAVSITGGDADITFNTFQYYNVRGIEIDDAVNFNISQNNFNRVDLESINLVSASGTQRNISDNYFLNESYALIPTSGIGIKCWPEADDVTINCNQIYYMNTGILIQDGCTGASILNNDIRNSYDAAVKAYEDLLNVTGNAIIYCYNGIETWKALTAHENLIYYNTNYAVVLHSNDTHDVSNNVWASYNGPRVLVNGININSYYKPQWGDSIQCNSFTNIKFTPWLQTYDDTDPETCGWQPNLAYSFAPVYANADSSATETEQYGSIQAAIDQSALPYIFAKIGNYYEQVTISRSVNLSGITGNSVLYPPLDRTGSVTDDSGTWDYMLAADGGSGTIDFRMQGFSFNANEQNNKAGTDYIAAALFRNVAGDHAGIYNCTISGFPFTALPESFGVKVCGNSVLTVDHNLIYSYTGDGINSSGGISGYPNADISNNTVVDWHEIPHCHNGIIFGPGVTGNIAYNVVQYLTRPGATAISVATDDLMINNNSIGSCLNGIKLTNASGITLIGNGLQSVHENGFILDNASNCILHGNSVEQGAGLNINAGLLLKNGSTGNVIGESGQGNSFMINTDGAGNKIGVHVEGSVGAGSNTISYNTFSDGKEMIKIDPGVTGNTIINNNWFGWNNASNVDVLLNGGSAEISNNIFNALTIRGIEIDGAINIDIHDNSFNYGSTDYAMKLINASGTKNIWNNIFFGTTGDALIAEDGGDNLVFDCNKVWYGPGVHIQEGCTGASIINNLFYYCDHGIFSGEDLTDVNGNSFGSAAIGIEAFKGLTAHYNYFGGNSTAALIIHSDEPHDVTNNFWGYYGPKVMSNGTNLNTFWQVYQTDLVECNTYTNIKFAPWLQDYTDTDNEACGIQPDMNSSFAPVYANNDGSATEVETYGSIQAAVDQSAMPYVFAEAGEFDERPVIDRPLSLKGLNYPVIEGGGGGGRVVTVAEDNVTVDGFEIRNSGTESDDAGVGLLDVTGCVVKNSLIHNNQKGLYLVNSPEAQILDNNIYNNLTYGIEMIGSELTNVSGNQVYSNPDGIKIGYSVSRDFSIYNVNDNNLSDNTNYCLIVDSGVPAVNAECNWWGSNDPAQIALRINGTAGFTPWITNGYDPDGTPGFQPYWPCVPCELLILTETHVDVDCPASPSGSVDLTVSGEIPPIAYVWTGPDGYMAYSEDLNAIYEGEYHVTVTFQNGCSKELTVVVGLVDHPAPMVPEPGFQAVECPESVQQPQPPNVTDYCNTPITPDGPSVGGTFNGCQGTVIYTWTYTDYQPKTSTWSFTYDVEYNGSLTPPAPGFAIVDTFEEAVDPGAPDDILDGCGRAVSAELVGSESSGTCGSTIVWTYRYTACDGITTADWTFTYTVNFVYGTIHGLLKYNNNPKTPLTNVTLAISPYGTNATSVSDEQGNFTFSGLCPGDYTITVTNINKPVDYINSSDAVGVHYWNALTPPVQHVRFLAGDVTDDDDLTATDALAIQNYFVFGNPFDRVMDNYNHAHPMLSAWGFWKAGDLVTGHADPNRFSPYPYSIPVTFNGDLNLTIYGQALGDYNGSYIPGNAKGASAALSMVYIGTRQADADAEVELPVHLVSASKVSAASLILNFPADLLEVTGVELKPETGNMEWNAKGGELRIGWNSLQPVNFEAGEALLTIHGRSSVTFSQGEEIDFGLVPSQLNELADGSFNVIPDAVLSMDKIEFSTTGTWNPESGIRNSLTLDSRPNPFTSYTMLNYELPKEGHVTLKICDALGREVALLIDEQQLSGKHAIKLEALPLQPGVYVATLTFQSKNGDMVRTIRLVREQ